MLARMEELRLVSRRRLEHDQRRVLISLTATSRALAKRMTPDIEAAYAEMERTLGPEFVEHCYAMLDRIGAALANPESGQTPSSAPISAGSRAAKRA